MKAAVLVKNGAADKAFEIQEVAAPSLAAGQVLVDVEAFGLNFADVMARQGLYQDCPPLPAIIGYEAVGRVNSWADDVSGFEKGQRVLAFTRFGAYATQVATMQEGVVPIPEAMPVGEAVALATQYCTAWYAAEEMVRLYAGDRVLIQSAAGGVGTALVQLAKHRGCYVFGTASTGKKLAYLKELGVDCPINYKESNFAKIIKQVSPTGKVDVVFDAVGGKSVKDGMKLLDAGGRMVCYGAASMSGSNKNVLRLAKTGLGFGLYSPIQLMMPSHSIIGVNMLRIADNKPLILQRCLIEVVKLWEKGVVKPTVGGDFAISELAQAHSSLANRQTIGKIVVRW